MAVSLDVIYHLIENTVFHEYMNALFQSSHKWVVIYSSNTTQEEFDKLYPTSRAVHVKHRRFSDWIACHAMEWKEVGQAPNRYPFQQEDPTNTAFAEFFAYEKQK